MAEAIKVDVLIFGGGIAGLWTLARLRREGYSCVLVESKALGSGQTIASQGIIHGGIKYALTGQASAASRAIAEMPGIWRACLEGRGEIDLRGVKVLSEKQYLWTTPGIGSRIAGVAASKVIRTAVRSVPQESRISPFDHAPRGVDVYEVEEPILDPFSLLSHMRELGAVAVLPMIEGGREFGRDASFSKYPVMARVSMGVPWGSIIRARAAVLCAGEGNESLLGSFVGGTRSSSPTMQRRPLHMVMMRAQHYREGLGVIYGHCVGLSDKPRITVTSQLDEHDRVVWYVGGQIAEAGVERGRDDQIKVARDEIHACIPWINLEGTQWATLRVNRAEGVAGAAGTRPDEPVVQAFDGVVAAWPTKLAFAPLTASLVHDRLRDMGIAPSGGDIDQEALASLVPPAVAQLPWNDGSTTWT